MRIAHNHKITERDFRSVKQEQHTLPLRDWECVAIPWGDRWHFCSPKRKSNSVVPTVISETKEEEEVVLRI